MYTPAIRRGLVPLFVSSCLLALLLLISCGGGGGTSTTPQPISNPAPTVSTVSPTTVTAGSASFTLTVTGSGFVNGSTVMWNGSTRSTTFVSATTLNATIAAADVASAATASITVSTPAPGGGTSAAITLTVENPKPVVTSTSPARLTMSHAGTSLTVNGTGFVTGSVITWNGTARTTSFVSSTQLQTVVTTADVASNGSVQIGVTNASPGGGAATPLAIAIEYPVPVLSSMSPSSVLPGIADFDLVVTGSGLTTVSVVQWNGSPRQTTYVSQTQLKAKITAADVTAAGDVQITVFTPAAGGGTSQALVFKIAARPVPILSRLGASSVYATQKDTALDLYGFNFQTDSVALWNATTIPTQYMSSTWLHATVPAAQLGSVVRAAISVSTPAPGGGASNVLNLDVLANPVPAIQSLTPSGVAVGSAATTVSIYGTGFTAASVVKWNGVVRTATVNSAGQIALQVPSSDLLSFGTSTVTVENPAPGGGTSNDGAFTTFLALPNKDLIFSKATGKLYASVPSGAGAGLGNSIVPIDPYTGLIGTPIWVGSEPGRLALSDDGYTLWVSLDGISGVRKVDLRNGVATPVQITIPGDGHTGNYTVTDIDVLPGTTDSIAIVTDHDISVYDGSVKRPKTVNAYASASQLAFGTSASRAYAVGNEYYIFNIDSTGITIATQNWQTSLSSSDVQYENGRLYLTSGKVMDPETQALFGTFAAQGPIAPDSSVGKAFMMNASAQYSSTYDTISAFDESTFVRVGTAQFGGGNWSSTNYYYPSNVRLLRFGQDGLAFRSDTQVFLLHSKLVRDLSSTQADLAVTLSAPTTGTTGTNITYTATVRNNGPQSANNISFVDAGDASMSIVSITPSQGACAGSGVLRCNLGTLASGASATVQFTATPLSSGTASFYGTVSADESDPNMANNTATGTTTVTGSGYALAPSVYSLSPSVAAEKSIGITVSISGQNFTAASKVQWNGGDLPTTFVNSSSLSAYIDPSLLANWGWGNVSVSTPGSGGGMSTALPFTIYKTVTLETNDIVFDPFTRKIYASVPSTATSVTGNSIVALDPTTGAKGTPANIGSEPKKLALSSDGKYIYAGLTGSVEVRRMDVATMAAGARFTVTPMTSGGPLYDLAVMPGNHDAVAVVHSDWDGIGIWDVAASGTATRRSKMGGIYEGIDIAFDGSGRLYSQSTSSSPTKLHRFTIDATGLTYIDETNLLGFWGPMTVQNGLVYSTAGGIANPLTTPPSLVGHFSVSANYYSYSSSMAADVPNKRSFFSSGSFVIQAFDHDGMVPSDQITLPLSTSYSYSSGYPKMIRWGVDGLAIRADGNQVVLLRGPFVLPALRTNQSMPTATSLSPTTTTAGSGNFYLTVNGSNFTPGAVVRWNGADRTTTFVSATQLSVAIPASDVASAKTAAVTVANPGTGESPQLTFTIL